MLLWMMEPGEALPGPRAPQPPPRSVASDGGALGPGTARPTATVGATAAALPAHCLWNSPWRSPSSSPWANATAEWSRLPESTCLSRSSASR